MFYSVIVHRNGRRLYLISPAYGRFMLSEHNNNRYGFDTEQGARAALLALGPFAVLPTDRVEIERHYNV